MEPPDVAALPEPLRSAVARVRDNRMDGASRIAQDVAEALAAASESVLAADAEAQLHALHVAARAFAASRPSMAAVANTAARIWNAGARLRTGDPVARLCAVNRAAEELLREASTGAERILEHSSSFLSGTLYTLSRSGTVEAVMRRLGQEAAAKGESRRIIVDQSLPGGEGVATSEALAGSGWEVTLVPDTACGLFIHDVAAVVFGADSVRADGSVVNKVGSFPLALMARHADVPVYALSETVKIAPSDFPLHFEEGNVRELLPQAITGVTVRVPAFDRTPPELITAVITERGSLSREEIARIAEQARTALQVLHVT